MRICFWKVLDSLVCFFGWHVLEANVKGTQPHNLHHESRSNSPTTREQQQRQLALTAACYSPTPFSSLQKTALLPTFHSSCCILVVLQNSVMNTKSQKKTYLNFHAKNFSLPC